MSRANLTGLILFFLASTAAGLASPPAAALAAEAQASVMASVTLRVEGMMKSRSGAT